MITRLHKQDNGILDFDSSVPCLVGTFVGFMPDDEFKDFLNLALNYMIEKKKEYGTIAWLPDATEFTVNNSEEWAAKDWNPRALAAGIRHVAFVLSKDVFGQTQINHYLELNESQTGNQMQTAMFEDLESAKKWLIKVLHKECS